MQATVEVLSGLERKITVKTSPDRVDQEVEKRLKEMLPKLKLDGFRPGKAPVHLLRQRFGESIRYEVIGQVIDATYREAITQEKLFPAGMPDIHITQNKAGDALEYQATVEVYPEVKLQSLASVELENIHVEIVSKDVDEMIHNLRRQKAKWMAVDRPSQKGDRVIVSFEGRQDGALFEGGSGKEVPLELGSGAAIAGFEEGFTGHKAGASVELELVFPAEYHVPSLAGKPVEFKGTLHKVQAPELSPLDDEFAKQLGVKEGGMGKLRETVLENMEREVKQKAQDHLKGQVLNKLLELNPVDLPKVLVQEELKKLQEQEQSYLSEITGSKQALPEPRDELQELAKRRVHLGVLFSELMDEHKVVADPERIAKRIAEISVAYDDPEMVVQAYRDNKQLYKQLEEKVTEDQLIDLLLAQTQQLQKNMTYAAFKGFKPVQEN